MNKILTLISASLVISALCGLTSQANAQAVTMTHSSNQTITSGASIACNNGFNTLANSYFRTFKISDFVSASSLDVDSVLFGVEGASSFFGSQPITVNLYSLTASSPTLTNLTLLNTVSGNIADMGPGIIRATIPASIAGTATLVVEVSTPDGTADENIFLIGCNDFSQTAPSYMYAPACAINSITDINDLGSNAAIVMTVFGRTNVSVPDSFINPINPVCERTPGVVYSVPAVTGVTYTWAYSGSGVTINPSGNSATLNFAQGATSGTLSVTATSGSATSDPLSIFLNVNPRPSAAISRSGNVLTTSNFPSYVWYRNNVPITNATNNSYTLTQNGDYFVKVGSSNGCTGNSDTVHINDITTTVNEINDANKIKIYPNPAKDFVIIDSELPVTATLHTMDGKTLIRVENAKGIDLKSLPSGIYFVTLSDKDGTYIKREKIVKVN